MGDDKGEIMAELMNSAPAAVWVVAFILALFFVKSVVESMASARARLRRTEMLETALRAEIAANADALTQVAAAHPQHGDWLPWPVAPTGRLLSTRIYDAHFEELTGLQSAIIAKAVTFYSAVNRFAAISSAIPQNTAADVTVLRRTADEIARLGRETLHVWDIHQPLRKGA